MTIVYATREHPRSGIDQVLVLEADEAGAVTIVRELGEAVGTQYVHAQVAGAGPPEWEPRWVDLRGDLELPLVEKLIRQRVVAYVTRERQGMAELLTIEVKDLPDLGAEVPAGRLDLGESLEEGLRRELEEETGLVGVRILAELPDFEATYTSHCENHAFHVVPETATPAVWEHRVHGDGADAGMIHVCRWVPLRRDLKLWNEGDPMLRHLPIAGA